jgi:hypothetical protein
MIPTGVLSVASAFALVLGMILLWWAGVRLFLWVTLTLASLVPHIGRKHRHSEWNELNAGSRGSDARE